MSESGSRRFSALSYRYVSEFDYALPLQMGTFVPHTKWLISKWLANDVIAVIACDLHWHLVALLCIFPIRTRSHFPDSILDSTSKLLYSRNQCGCCCKATSKADWLRQDFLSTEAAVFYSFGSNPCNHVILSE